MNFSLHKIINELLGLFLFAGLFIFGSVGTAQAVPVHAGYSSVELVAEHRTAKSGAAASMGIRLTPDASWHTYWINPGDAGKSIRVTWDNPEGVVASALTLPAPHNVPFMSMVSYGYDEEILVTFDVQIPGTYKTGDQVHLAGSARWLVCDDQNCVPQDAEISFDVTIGDGASSGGLTKEFDAARAKIPTPVNWSAQYSPYNEDDILLYIEMPSELGGYDHADLFPAARKLVDHATVKLATIDKPGIAFLAKAGRRLVKTDTSDLVLVLEKNGVRKAYRIPATKSDLSAMKAAAKVGGSKPSTAHGETPPASGQERPANGEEASSSFMVILVALGSAILGGLILNLMPCVLPILSLKALSLAKLSGEDLRTARMNGLVYTAGILFSFLAFAFVLVTLRSAGGLAGWGFQMQNPVVLTVLILFIGAIGANLAGVFEFSSRFASVGQDMTQGGGYKAEFFTGVLVVVVASTCTAPFLGGALGFALTQPLYITILIFSGLGLGLALPYLLLCYFPAARKWMPKPGAWMDSFKQFLAFPMFATALWLLWVLGNQVGSEYVLGVLVLALVISMVFWAMSKGQQSPRKILWNIFAIVLLGSALWTAAQLPGLKAQKQISGEADILASEPYTLAKLEGLLADNQSVFVYFTADWCITCKVNEKNALHKPKVAEAFAEKNIRVLVGDWTNPDNEIAEMLKLYGRVGVPLYLYYTPGTAIDKAKVLPQMLTVNGVINAL